MTQQKQVEITRRQDIVVAAVSTNSYGDLEFTDTEGGSYKIAVRRVLYFKDIILPQRAVRLNYTTAYGKEYIYNAVPAEQIITAKEPAVKSTATAVKSTTEVGKIIPNEGKNRAFALSYSKDLAVADKIKVEEIISYATVFDMYLSGEFSESKNEILAKYVAKYGRKEDKEK